MILLPSSLIHESVSFTWDPLCWHSRRLFCQMTRRHEEVLDQLFDSVHLSAPSLDPPEPASSAPHFVDSFDPAIAGMHLLMVECFDNLLHVAPPPPNTVSVDLHANPSHHHAFPLIIESTYSSIASTQDPPLISDSGASCCISPCKHDFQSYSPSSAQIKDLSVTNTVAGEGLLWWHVLDRHGWEQSSTSKGTTSLRPRFISSAPRHCTNPLVVTGNKIYPNTPWSCWMGLSLMLPMAVPTFLFSLCAPPTIRRRASGRDVLPSKHPSMMSGHTVSWPLLTKI